MILPSPRIFICTEDTDMRMSFQALCGVIRRSMNLDPHSGFLFIFKNKRADRIKILFWDRDGFAMWYKLLSKGTFRFPDLQNFSSAGVEIEPSTLRLILDGIDLSSIRKQNRFTIEPTALKNAYPSSDDKAQAEPDHYQTERFPDIHSQGILGTSEQVPRSPSPNAEH